MKYIYLLITTFALASCDHFQNDKWQSHWQQIDLGVTGGSDEGASNPFGGAFGDNFHYQTQGSSLYWGDEGAKVNSHYSPYQVGSSTQYYRGTDEFGNYGVSSTGGY